MAAATGPLYPPAGRGEEPRQVEFRRLLVVDRNPECQAAPTVRDPTRELVVKDWDAFFDAYLGDAAEPSRRPPSAEPSTQRRPLTTDASPRISGCLAGETVATRVVESAVVRRAGNTIDVTSPDLSDTFCSPTGFVHPLYRAEPLPRYWGPAPGDARSNRGPTHGSACRHRFCSNAAIRSSWLVAFRCRSSGGDCLLRKLGAGEETDLVVGTVSACHGAINLLHLGPG